MQLYCKFYLVLVIILFTSFGSHAQDIIVNSLFSDYDVYNLSTREVTHHACDDIPGNIKFSLFYHAKEEFVSIITTDSEFTQEGDLRYFSRVFNLDYEACTYDSLSKPYLPGLNLSYANSVIYMDYRGKVYYTGSNEGDYFIFNRNSIYTDEVNTNYYCPHNYVPADMLFYQGKIYIFYDVIQTFTNPRITTGTNRVDVLDEDFNYQYHFFAPIPILNMTSVVNDCDSIINYAVGYDIPLVGEDNDLYIYNTDTAKLFEYDLDNNVVTYVDDLFYNEIGYSFVYATSATEFLASDPSCDLLIDLDRDNSSGLLPYDFKNLQVICGNDQAKLVDDDLYIHTSMGIDSIQLTIEDKTFPTENLNGKEANGFKWTEKGNGVYLLYSPDNKSDEEYRDVLKNITYSHGITEGWDGNKTITIQGFSAGLIGEEVKSFLTFKKGPNSGKDTTIMICPMESINDMSTLLNGDGGGIWFPQLMGGGDFYNSNLDLHQKYFYIIEDQACGNDTAVLNIAIDDRTLDLGPDQDICNGEVFDLVIDTLVDDKLTWDDNFIGANRQIVSPNTYVASIETDNNCILVDTIVFTNRYNLYHDTINLCIGDMLDYDGVFYAPGERIIDTMLRPNTCDSILHLYIKQQSVIEISTSILVCDDEPFINEEGNTLYAGDSYQLLKEAIGLECDTLITVNIDAIPRPQPEIFGEPIVCFGLSANLYSSNHSNYIWSTGSNEKEIEVGPGWVTLSVIDSINCVGVDSIFIVEKPDWIIDIEDSIEIQSGLLYDIDINTEQGRLVSININPNEGINYLENENKIQVNSREDQTYSLVFRDDIGCLVERDLHVSVLKEGDIFAPNIINLHADDVKNRSWKIQLGNGLSLVEAAIFDRWGNQVFGTTDINQEWNGVGGGNTVSQGVYIYTILANNLQGNQILKSGDLTVIK